MAMNSVENKFYLYSEVEQCEKVIQDYFTEKEKTERKLRNKSQKAFTTTADNAIIIGSRRYMR